MNSMLQIFSRFVIAAAMVTAGWVNCFVFVEVSPDQVTTLQALELHVQEAGSSDEGVQGTQKTRGLNRMTLMLHHEWPLLGGWATLLSWAVAMIELLAGGLLLVGLFSRAAAFAVCAIMAMALYLVSYKLNGMFAMNPFDWPLQHESFTQLFSDMSLFVLALGIVVVGPGACSIDRFQSGKYSGSNPHAKRGKKKGES